MEHESHVSLEIVKLLKQLGFDWHCRGYFDGKEFHPDGSVECTNYFSQSRYLKAPTLYVAQRWLREVKHCFVNVYVDVDDNECVNTIVVEPFTCGYIIEGFSYCNNSPGDDYIRNEYRDRKYFDTYESALEAGILKCLTLLLERNNDT